MASLPKREADLFKSVVKQYEQKQYKKALKNADAILKKHPNHGETLAMKGLVLQNMGKGEEAHTLVKQGLMNDMRYVDTVRRRWNLVQYRRCLPTFSHLFFLRSGLMFVGMSMDSCIAPITITTNLSKHTNRL